MKLCLDRTASDAESTLGRLFLIDVDGETRHPLCWTCEDEHRETKVMHETRIPRGNYRLGLKPLGSSRFDAAYTRRFGALHRGMIEILNVPGFTGVLIHIGNTERDTSGCILLGNAWGRDVRGHYQVLQSEAAYRRIYPLVAEALLAGEEVTLAIRDLDRSAA
jgi:hypothetical protein